MPRKAAKKTNVSHRVKRAVKHVAVPHKGNGYHPYAIRGKGLIVVLAIVAALQLIPASTIKQTTVLGDATDVTSQRLLDDTNAERTANGVEPLTIDRRLAVAATNKSKDMFEKQYWSHTSPDGTTPWYWIRDAQYNYSFAGENLAKGFRTSSGLISAWMDSSQHRNNLLNPDYKNVGFAVVEGQLNGETTKLVVAVYGTPAQASSVAATKTTVLGATGSLSPVARIGVGLQSMTPALLASVILLMIVMIIALAAHAYRKYLPKNVLNGWRRHHGLYKAVGMTCLVFVLIALYGGGQI